MGGGLAHGFPGDVDDRAEDHLAGGGITDLVIAPGGVRLDQVRPEPLGRLDGSPEVVGVLRAVLDPLDLTTGVEVLEVGPIRVIFRLAVLADDPVEGLLDAVGVLPLLGEVGQSRADRVDLLVEPG